MLLESLRSQNNALELKAESTGLTSAESEARKEILIKIKGLEAASIRDLKQKSRVKWAVDGHENSHFFHGLINQNQRSNFIHGLSINGVWVTKPAEVKKSPLISFLISFPVTLLRGLSFSAIGLISCLTIRRLISRLPSQSKTSRKQFGTAARTKLLDQTVIRLPSTKHSGPLSKTIYSGLSNSSKPPLAWTVVPMPLSSP